MLGFLSALAPIAGKVIGGFFGGDKGSDIGSGVGQAISSAGAGYASQQGQQQANTMNLEEASRVRDFNADQAEQQRAWSAQQAQISRDFNAGEAQSGREFAQSMFNQQATFNDTEAEKNRAWQAQMSNTQYQRAVGDMQAAGLNPMLAYTQGGAGTPSGGSASVSGQSASSASSSPASGASASGPASSRLESIFGPGVQSAMQAADVMATVDNKHAQNDLIRAQAEANRAGAMASRQSAGKTYLETELMADTFGNQVDRIVADAGSAQQREEALRFQNSMNPVMEALRRGEISLQQAEIIYKRAAAGLTGVETRLKTLDIPGAINQANYESSAMGHGMPYLRGVGDLAGSAVGSAFGLKRLLNPLPGVKK